ncbi:acyl-CoA thioesterase [Faecalibacter bovis]|uniref:Acyl-CoA thioesterase n=1 Tax=Faecalibacter bovis TaxID=2898187 RepID=A0ABX7XCL5_9FLAO|nr:acyl-CoA thioesterase [Faecalibacter bovis]QTV05537.1 acyl-CoA thioesterase [Faecalibacter bovis]
MIYKTVESSLITFSQLMLPSHSNFSGKIHGGYLLSLMDQIAFACASKYSGKYCVTASVDRVDFLTPVEVGELVTLNASVNYVGNTSMVIGIRVESQNVQTGEIRHCNSSYFTMICKEENGEKADAPKLILRSANEVRRFYKALHRIEEHKKAALQVKNPMDYHSEDLINYLLEHYNVKIQLDSRL